MHRQSTAAKKRTSPTSHRSNKFSHQAFLKKWKPGKSRNQVMTSRKTSQETSAEKRKGHLSGNKQGELNNNTTTSGKPEEEEITVIEIEDSTSDEDSKDCHSVQNSKTEHVPCNKSVDVNSENIPDKEKSDKTMLPDSVEPKPAVEELGKTEKSVPQTLVADKTNKDSGDKNSRDKDCSISIIADGANSATDSNVKNQEVEEVKARVDEALPARKRRGNPKEKVESMSVRSSRSRSKSSEGQTAQNSVCSTSDDKDDVIILDEPTKTKDTGKPSSDAAVSSAKSDKKKTDGQRDAEKTKSTESDDSVSTKKFPVVVLGPIEDSEWKLLSDSKSKKRQSVSTKPDEKPEKAKPDETSEKAKPDETSEKAKPDKKTEKAKPDKKTEKATPDKKTEKEKPDKKTEKEKPDKKTEKAKPDEKLEKAKPDEKPDSDNSTPSSAKNSGLSTRTPRRKVAKRAYSPSDDSFTKPVVVIKTEPGLSELPTPPPMVSATPPSGKRSKNYCLESVLKPFEIGWMREIVHRATGKGIDVYYFTPEGKKLRSMNDIAKYLSEHKKSGLTTENFTFAKDSIYREPFEKVRGARIRTVDGAEITPVVKIEPPDTPPKTASKKTPGSAAKGGKQKEESQSSSNSELKKTKAEGSSSKGKKSLKATPKIKLFPGLLRRPSKLKMSSPDKDNKDSITSLSEDDTPVSVKAKKDSLSSPAESTVTAASKSVANTPSSKNSASSEKVSLETPVSDKPSDDKDATNKNDDVVQLGQVSSTSNEKRARKAPRRFLEEREKSPLQKKARIKYTEVKKATPIPRPCTNHCSAAAFQEPSVQCGICLCMFHQQCVPQATKTNTFVCKICSSKSINKKQSCTQSPVDKESCDGTPSQKDPAYTDVNVQSLLPEVTLFMPDSDPAKSLNTVASFSSIPPPPPLQKAPDSSITIEQKDDAVRCRLPLVPPTNTILITGSPGSLQQQQYLQSTNIPVIAMGGIQTPPNPQQILSPPRFPSPGVQFSSPSIVIGPPPPLSPAVVSANAGSHSAKGYLYSPNNNFNRNPGGPNRTYRVFLPPQAYVPVTDIFRPLSAIRNRYPFPGSKPVFAIVKNNADSRIKISDASSRNIISSTITSIAPKGSASSAPTSVSAKKAASSATESAAVTKPGGNSSTKMNQSTKTYSKKESDGKDSGANTSNYQSKKNLTTSSKKQIYSSGSSDSDSDVSMSPEPDDYLSASSDSDSESKKKNKLKQNGNKNQTPKEKEKNASKSKMPGRRHSRSRSPRSPNRKVKKTVSTSSKAISCHIAPSRSSSALLRADLSTFTAGYDCLNTIFRNMKIPDLLRASQVCRSWNMLVAQRFLWEKISFQGIFIKDWARCTESLRNNGTKVLNLRGMHVGENNLWNDFIKQLNNLSGLEHITFGQVPPAVLDSVADRLPLLECLECHCLTTTYKRPDLWSTPCHMKFFNLRFLKRLRRLKIRSAGGLLSDGEPMEVTLLPNLQHLSLTSLKNFPSSYFNFLTKMTNLVSLELGDCCSWTKDNFGHVGKLVNLHQLRLENGGGFEIGLSEALTKLTKLEELELMKFIIPGDLGTALESLQHLSKLSLWPDNSLKEAAQINYNAFHAASRAKNVIYFCWGIISPDDCIPLLPMLKEAAEGDNISDAEFDEIHYEDIFERLCTTMPDAKVEMKCISEDFLNEYCSIQR